MMFSARPLRRWVAERAAGPEGREGQEGRGVESHDSRERDRATAVSEENGGNVEIACAIAAAIAP